MAFCISSRCNLCWHRFTNNDEIQAVNARGDTITDMTFNPKEWQFYMNTHSFQACVGGRCTHMGPNISFHTECYEKVHMDDTKGLWHRFHMVSEAIHDFEPAIAQEKRRMDWFRSQVFNDVAVACAPFPQELRDIVVDYVAQDKSHIIGTCSSRWNKALDIYKKEDFGDVAGWKGMFVTYTMYEGVRYVETISNRRDRTSDRQVLVKPISGPVDTIYVSHDHLGVRDVATCNSSGKQPIFHEEPGVWWNTISLAPGRCHLLWTRDSRKLRMLVQPDQAEENRRRRRPALWFTRVPTPEKFRFNSLTLLDEPMPHRYSPVRLGSRGLTGYSFQWGEGLRTIVTHSDDPSDDRLYNLPKRRWRSVWLYMPIDEDDHITNIWLRKSFSKSNCLVFRTKKGRMHMMGTYPDEGWTGGLYVTWAAGLKADDYFLFDDSPKKIQGIAVPARIPKGKSDDPALTLQDPVSRKPRWETKESFLSTASMENIVSFRSCYRRIVKSLCLVGMLFEYQDGHKEVVGQVRPDKLGKATQVTESADALWLFSVNGIYVRANLSRESKANETATEIPFRGQVEWWFAAYGAVAQHVETEALSEPEPIRTFVEQDS